MERLMKKSILIISACLFIILISTDLQSCLKHTHRPSNMTNVKKVIEYEYRVLLGILPFPVCKNIYTFNYSTKKETKTKYLLFLFKISYSESKLSEPFLDLFHPDHLISPNPKPHDFKNSLKSSKHKDLYQTHYSNGRIIKEYHPTHMHKAEDYYATLYRYNQFGFITSMQSELYNNHTFVNKYEISHYYYNNNNMVTNILSEDHMIYGANLNYIYHYDDMNNIIGHKLFYNNIILIAEKFKYNKDNLMVKQTAYVYELNEKRTRSLAYSMIFRKYIYNKDSKK